MAGREGLFRFVRLERKTFKCSGIRSGIAQRIELGWLVRW